jgi:ribosome-associated translation inhibitor RaiA
MNIEIKGLGLELTDDLYRLCERRIVAPLRRIYDREGPYLEIELSDLYGPKGGKDKRCRITYTMPATRTLTVVEVTDDIYKSIDYAALRFERLVKRYKNWKLRGTRYPKKYYVAELQRLREPGETFTPDDITVEEDSLAAWERRRAARGEPASV